MSYLLIGLGRRGMLHLRVLSNRMLPVYVYDANVKGAEFSAYSSAITPLASMRNVSELSNLTLAIIATPSSTHLEILKQILPMGCKVLVEKPLVTSKVDMDYLPQLPQQEIERIYVGYAERFNPTVSSARARITRALRSKTAKSAAFRRARPLAQATPGASPCMELLVHDLDFVLNDVFRSFAVDRLKVVHGTTKCSASFSISAVQIDLESWWTDGLSVSRAEVHHSGGQVASFDLSSGGNDGRALALKRQLDHIHSSPISVDVEREMAVLGVLFCV